AYMDRGEAYLNLGKVDEGLADQTTAIRLDPAVPRTWTARGAAYLRMGRYAEALADLKQASRLGDPDADIQELMSLAQKGVTENQVAAAAVAPPIPPSPVWSDTEANPLPAYTAAVDVRTAEPLSPSHFDQLLGRPEPRFVPPLPRAPSIAHSILPMLPAAPQVQLKSTADLDALTQSVPMLTPMQAPRRKFAPVVLVARSTPPPTRPLPAPPPVESPNPGRLDSGVRSVLADLIKVAPPPTPRTALPSSRTPP